MKNIMERYRYATVGLSGIRGHKVEHCRILSMHGDYFSLSDINSGAAIHVPYSSICHLVESDGNGRARFGFWSRRKYSLLIKIGPAIQYLPT
jgi:hypothetical protein